MPLTLKPLPTFILAVAGTMLGLAGTDLILPAVPGLPAILGGDLARAQLVLASFTAGTACGLILFGELAGRLSQRLLLTYSLVAYSLTSLLCANATDIDMLIGLRFVQGAAGSAAAVFAPGLIRAVYGHDKAVRAIGALGSIEALTPALAPIAGVWLLHAYGWQASFDLIAALAMLLAILVAFVRLPDVSRAVHPGGFFRLIRDPVFLRYSVSQACTLAALLVVVFAAPTVFTRTMGGSLSHFIEMQMAGVATFIVAANTASRFSSGERLILTGTALSAAAGTGMVLYALAGGGAIAVIIALFITLNIGLGLRSPSGFHTAILAARGDDARGSAFTILAILGLTSLGTAAVAPFVTRGLIAPAVGAAVLSLSGLALLRLPKLEPQHR
ncbi:MFS transporter [Sphingomonas sp. ID0503]|uniref:MFS transporter n=1 Tax=Sphingomonas sp. ID0503 TaxID=3399691 RepID=UPI003AFA1E27